jgi:hypothetical protein
VEKENQCTGCGEILTEDKSGLLVDSIGSVYCDAKMGITPAGGLHRVELPPVAIKPEAAPQVWFRETETLNFLYIARPDGRFLVVAMETERGDIYAIENSPARNPSAKPMAVHK